MAGPGATSATSPTPRPSPARVDLAFVELGGLSVVCNVAGIGQFYRTETLDPAVFDRIIAVNLRGTFLVCRFALPAPARSGLAV